MRSSKSVISAMLGIAFLAMPITAAARPERNPGRFQPAPRFHPAPAFRPAAGGAMRAAPAPRFNFNSPARNFVPPVNLRAENKWKVTGGPARNWNGGNTSNGGNKWNGGTIGPMPPIPPNHSGNGAPGPNVLPGGGGYISPQPNGWPRPVPPVPPSGGNVGPNTWNRGRGYTVPVVPPPSNQGWIPPGQRRDYGWQGRQEPDRDDYRTVCDGDGDDCRQVPYYRQTRTVCDDDGDDCRQVPYQRYSYASPEPMYQPSYHPYYNDMPYICDQDGDDCRPNSSYDGGYNDVYSASPQYYFMPMQGERLITYRARLVQARDNAVYQYRIALNRGNRVRARHLYNAVQDLNRRIARVNVKIAQQNGGGYATPYTYTGASAYSGLGAYTDPYANSYNSYGYSPYGSGAGTGGLASVVAPLLGGFNP